ncbi:MAG: hypothetical protein U0790_12040 [Isosphaeraceae bacterium]
MVDQPQSNLAPMVVRLVDLVRPFDEKLAATAAATLGRCRYMSGSIPVCVNGITKASCNCISAGSGSWKEGITCAQGVVDDDEELCEISAATVFCLVRRLNAFDAASLNPSPVGACHFSVDGEQRCIETTRDFCVTGLEGSFTLGATCPASQPDEAQSSGAS